MIIDVLKSKIHCAKVTNAELNYVGSITIDEDWMDAVGLRHNEKVLVVNNNNGERLETYAIRGERKSGIICLNGAAARKVAVGDIVIIIAFGQLTEEEYKSHQPKIIFPFYTDNKLIMKGSYKTFDDVLLGEFKRLYVATISASSKQKEIERIALQYGLTVEETQAKYNQLKPAE